MFGLIHNLSKHVPKCQSVVWASLSPFRPPGAHTSDFLSFFAKRNIEAHFAQKFAFFSLFTSILNQIVHFITHILHHGCIAVHKLVYCMYAKAFSKLNALR